MKKTLGRPKGVEYPVSIAVRLTAELAGALDEIRGQEKDIPNRSEMIRRLISKKSTAIRKKRNLTPGIYRAC